MSANDEFPRGWTLAARPATGAQAVVTVPAIPGVAHVITDIYSSAFQTAAVAVDFVIIVTSGGVALFSGFSPLNELAGPAAVNTLVTAQWGGKFAGRVGQDVTIALNAPQASIEQALIVNGYDI